MYTDSMKQVLLAKKRALDGIRQPSMLINPSLSSFKKRILWYEVDLIVLELINGMSDDHSDVKLLLLPTDVGDCLVKNSRVMSLIVALLRVLLSFRRRPSTTYHVVHKASSNTDSNEDTYELS